MSCVDEVGYSDAEEPSAGLGASRHRRDAHRRLGNHEYWPFGHRCPRCSTGLDHGCCGRSRRMAVVGQLRGPLAPSIRYNRGPSRWSDARHNRDAWPPKILLLTPFYALATWLAVHIERNRIGAWRVDQRGKQERTFSAEHLREDPLISERDHTRMEDAKAKSRRRSEARARIKRTEGDPWGDSTARSRSREPRNRTWRHGPFGPLKRRYYLAACWHSNTWPLARSGRYTKSTTTTAVRRYRPHLGVQRHPRRPHPQ